MTRVSESAVLIGHEGVRAPVRVVVGRVVGAPGSGTRSARVIPSRAPVTASRTRTHRTLTEQRDERSQTRRVLGVVGGAHHRRDRAFEGAEDLAHPDLGGVAGELVAAVGAPRRDDEAGVAEAHDELLEIRAGEVFLRRDLGE